MLERWIFKAEEELNFFKLFVEIFFLVILLSGINYLLGGNFIFLVALTSVTLAYPITKYIRRQDHLDLERFDDKKNFFERIEKELIVGWCLFLAVTSAFIVSYPLLKDVSLQANFYNSISGAITHPEMGFLGILSHNIYVALIVGLISLISTSGLIFTLTWNSSILVYVIVKAANFSESLGVFLGSIGHGLLEIAGYIFIGLAASLISYRFERYKRYPNSVNKTFAKDIWIMTAISISFIFFAALFEVL